MQFSSCGNAILVVENVSEFAAEFGARHFAYKRLFSFSFYAKTAYFFVPLNTQTKVGIFDLVALQHPCYIVSILEIIVVEISISKEESSTQIRQF